jgi:hypothetical protein
MDLKIWVSGLISGSVLMIVILQDDLQNKCDNIGTIHSIMIENSQHWLSPPPWPSMLLIVEETEHKFDYGKMCECKFDSKSAYVCMMGK